MNFQEARRKLEFQKVLDRILRYASSEPGRTSVLNLDCLVQLREINEELSLVSEVKTLLEQESDIALEGLHDVRGPLRRAAIGGTVLTPTELLQVASTLRTARLIRAFVAKHSSNLLLFWPLVEQLHTQKVLEFNIEHAIDESGIVRESASKELRTIRRSIIDRYDRLRKRLDRILKSVSVQGFSQDDIITTREGRMVIPVKVEHKSRVPGFVHSASSSGATVFIEPTETLELNNEITDLQFQERRETERILAELTRQVGEINGDILGDIDILARVDSLKARAKYSIEVLGVQPSLSEEGAVRLKGARHPALLASHGFDGTVPLDLDIGEDYSTLIISGPNAGGKSVALKSVGLLSLMAQTGIHIPASPESTLRLFQKVFVDIGDDQSIENDLSTFSSHLTNLKTILKEADASSLVLVDEIGSGTDPAEGGALASAILEELTSRRALTIATTHQGSLKAFAHETERVENGAMEFDPETLRPTYRFRCGIPGSSYALEMARRLDLGNAVLSRAGSMLGANQSRLENLLVKLEEMSQAYRRNLESAVDERAKVEALRETYEAKLALHREEVKTLRRDAIAEAGRIVANANALIEESVRRIRESSADRETIRQVQQDVRSFKAAIDKETSEDLPGIPPEPITVGSTVRLRVGTEAGRVESLGLESETAFVVFGNVRMRVPLADLVLFSGDHVRTSSNIPLQAMPGGAAELREIDIRGLTGEEAIPLVDKFIDNAYLSGLHRIDIIHGKGTGALRKRVTEFLQKHVRVKSFRLGEWNEGGSGATVVELSE